MIQSTWARSKIRSPRSCVPSFQSSHPQRRAPCVLHNVQPAYSFPAMVELFLPQRVAGTIISAPQIREEYLSTSQAVAQHLPFLRRYARAFTGNQTSGDAYGAATIEALIEDPRT